jgi:hypothetical protein
MGPRIGWEYNIELYVGVACFVGFIWVGPDTTAYCVDD